MPKPTTDQAVPSSVEPSLDSLQPRSDHVVQVQDSQKQEKWRADVIPEQVTVSNKRKWGHDGVGVDADPEEGDGVEYIRKKLKSSAGIATAPQHALPPSLTQRQQFPPSSFQPPSGPKQQLPSPPPSTNEKDVPQAKGQAQSTTNKNADDPSACTVASEIDSQPTTVTKISRPYQCNPRLYFTELQAHLAREAPVKKQD